MVAGLPQDGPAEDCPQGSYSVPEAACAEWCATLVANVACIVLCCVVLCCVVLCCVVLCCVVLCCVVLCCVVLCCVVLCCVVLCCVVLCCVVLCCVVLCCVVLCCVVLCCVVLCCVVLCCVVLCCVVVWCGVVWCGVVWCGVVWCGVLCCVVLCWPTCAMYGQASPEQRRSSAQRRGCAAASLSFTYPWACSHAMHRTPASPAALRQAGSHVCVTCFFLPAVPWATPAQTAPRQPALRVSACPLRAPCLQLALPGMRRAACCPPLVCRLPPTAVLTCRVPSHLCHLDMSVPKGRLPGCADPLRWPPRARQPPSPPSLPPPHPTRHLQPPPGPGRRLPVVPRRRRAHVRLGVNSVQHPCGRPRVPAGRYLGWVGGWCRARPGKGRAGQERGRVGQGRAGRGRAGVGRNGHNVHAGR